MKIEKCKGMRDLFSADMAKFQLINEIFRHSCSNWGYEEVKTPTLESLHLFTSAGTLTPSMLGKVYSFLDWDGWSGERVVLRPDATIPVARLYSENMTNKELAKLFYIVNTFIFEESGKKNREKWQFGAELIGIRSPMADVELIVLALEILEKLGVGKVELKLSHAGLTRCILQKLGLNQEEQHQVFDRLLDGDPSVLNQLQAEQPGLAPLLALQGQSSGFVKNLATALALDLPELKPQIDDLVFIANTLQSLGHTFQIDIASVRGFEYYTGAIFQLYVNEEKIGGGGRYDDLITSMGGKPTPASGFAIYLDLLMKLIDISTINVQKSPGILVKMDADAAKTGFQIAKMMRERGYKVKFHLGGQGPTDTDWRLEVHNSAPFLILSDLSNNKVYQMQTPEEVLEKLNH